MRQSNVEFVIKKLAPNSNQNVVIITMISATNQYNLTNNLQKHVYYALYEYFICFTKFKLKPEFQN